MFVPPADRVDPSDQRWRRFLADHPFGQLVAAGAGRDVPVVSPGPFVVDGDRVLLHVAAPNPVLGALAENPVAVLSVAADWATVPSAWKAVADEDPLLGIPTTYYAAVQLTGRATVHADPDAVADVLRRQLDVLQPGWEVADPGRAHRARLRAIRAVVLDVTAVVAKFKYGGNLDDEHRRAVIGRLEARDGPGDRAAARQARITAGDPPT